MAKMTLDVPRGNRAKDKMSIYDAQEEPKNVQEALEDENWIMTMQEELNQFERCDVWELVKSPKNASVIGTKWIFKNKVDEFGIVTQNKARLVAQGYNQQEGIDFDQTYAPVARLESIRMLLAYACYKKIKLHQMDVKSAFLNGFLEEEVYLKQPPVFKREQHPDYVYKLKKALYGLKQAPRACEFDMSMMGELNYFLGLQIKQSKDDIYVHQSKLYEILESSVAKFQSIVTILAPSTYQGIRWQIFLQNPLAKQDFLPFEGNLACAVYNGKLSLKVCADEVSQTPDSKKLKLAVSFDSPDLEQRFIENALDSRPILPGIPVNGKFLQQSGALALFQTVGMDNFVLELPKVYYPDLVREFYANLHEDKFGNCVSTIRDKRIRLNPPFLSSLIKFKNPTEIEVFTGKGYVMLPDFSIMDQFKCLLGSDSNVEDNPNPHPLP
ncbi:hypothetical protein AgCh_020641 [Apium graveolens]